MPHHDCCMLESACRGVRAPLAVSVSTDHCPLMVSLATACRPLAPLSHVHICIAPAMSGGTAVLQYWAVQRLIQQSQHGTVRCHLGQASRRSPFGQHTPSHQHFDGMPEQYTLKIERVHIDNDGRSTLAQGAWIGGRSGACIDAFSATR